MKLKTLTTVLLGLFVAVMPAEARRYQSRRTVVPSSTVTINAETKDSSSKTLTDSETATETKTKIVKSGSYNSREDVAAYIKKFGKLPNNFITKAEARRLGWHGGPVEPYAPGKSIGGDHFGNYEQQLPPGRYKECDIDTQGYVRRGAKRIVFSEDRRVYYTSDHYQTFEEVK